MLRSDLLSRPSVGDWVYITRKQPTASDPSDDPQKTKQMSKAIGPFQVICATPWNVTIVRADGTVEQITRERAVKAPGASSELFTPYGKESGPQNLDESEQPAHRVIRTRSFSSGSNDDSKGVESSEEDVRHPIRRIVKYDKEKDKFLIEWEGYPNREEWTEEPPGHLHYNTMLQFFRSKRRKIPQHLKQYRPN